MQSTTLFLLIITDHCCLACSAFALALTQATPAHTCLGGGLMGGC